VCMKTVHFSVSENNKNNFVIYVLPRFSGNGDCTVRGFHYYYSYWRKRWKRERSWRSSQKVTQSRCGRHSRSCSTRKWSECKTHTWFVNLLIPVCDCKLPFCSLVIFQHHVRDLALKGCRFQAWSTARSQISYICGENIFISATILSKSQNVLINAPL